MATTHGLRKHPLYLTWYGMMRRCYNPQHSSFKDYGARGITVAYRWHDLSAFIEDIDQLLGPKPKGMTLDRIDNEQGYKPGNVKWSTWYEQSRNKRPRYPAKLTLDDPRKYVVAYLELKEEILNGSIPNGTPLGMNQLAQRFGVGRDTVQTALGKLADEKLVKRWPGKGWYSYNNQEV